MNFDLAPAPINEILDLIAKTPTGGRILRTFWPSYLRAQVAFQPYPEHIVRKLGEYLEPGIPVGACFVNDGERGTIHYDSASPLGVLAPFIFHEIVHSLDAELWEAARRRVPADTRREIQHRAEVSAFRLQRQLVRELEERFPKYRNFLKTRYARARIVDADLGEREIAEMYGKKAG